MIKKNLRPAMVNVLSTDKDANEGTVSIFLNSQSNPLGIKAEDGHELFESYFEELRSGRVYILFRNTSNGQNTYLPIEISNPQTSGEIADISRKVSEAFLTEYGKECEKRQETNVEQFLNIIGPMFEGKLDMMSIMSNASSVMSFFENDVYDFSVEYLYATGVPNDENIAKFYKNLWNSLDTQVSISKLNLKKAWRNPSFMAKITPIFGKFLGSGNDKESESANDLQGTRRILRMN